MRERAAMAHGGGGWAKRLARRAPRHAVAVEGVGAGLIDSRLERPELPLPHDQLLRVLERKWHCTRTARCGLGVQRIRAGSARGCAPALSPVAWSTRIPVQYPHRHAPDDTTARSAPRSSCTYRPRPACATRDSPTRRERPRSGSGTTPTRPSGRLAHRGPGSARSAKITGGSESSSTGSLAAFAIRGSDHRRLK